MSESFSNTNPSAYSSPTVPSVGTSTPAQNGSVTQPTQTATTVNMTNSEQNATQTAQVGEKDKTTNHLDINEDYTVPTDYIQKYLTSSQNNTQDIRFSGDENITYNFGNYTQQELVKSFKDRFLREKNERDEFTAAQQLFASLDNQNYIYGRVFHQGNWINTRTPIDENGKAIGLPEMLTA